MMAPLSINTSSSTTNRTIKSISLLSLSTSITSNQSSMKQLIRLIGIAILCFGAGKFIMYALIILCCVIAMQYGGLFYVVC